MWGGTEKIPYTLISRIIDLEEFYEGEKQETFLWEKNSGCKISDNAERLVSSMDHYGVNPRLGKARMRGDGSSFFIEDGQHRVAWHYVNRQMFVPVRVFWNRKLLANEAECNFTDYEKRVLQEKYVEISYSLRNYLVAILDERIVKILSDRIQGLGLIEPYLDREIVRGEYDRRKYRVSKTYKKNACKNE